MFITVPTGAFDAGNLKRSSIKASDVIDTATGQAGASLQPWAKACMERPSVPADKQYTVTVLTTWTVSPECAGLLLLGQVPGLCFRCPDLLAAIPYTMLIVASGQHDSDIQFLTVRVAHVEGGGRASLTDKPFPHFLR